MAEHLTFAEVVNLQRPSPHHIASVRQYLHDQGALELAASLAEDKIVAIVPENLSRKDLPASVANAIDTLAGMPRPNPATPPLRRSHRSRAALGPDPQSCLADRAVPPCLRKAYGIVNETASAPGNGQAVVVNQGYKYTDLAAFCKEYDLTACAQQVHDVGKNTGEPGDEASLDVQYISATGQGVPLWWVELDGHAANPFANWLVWASNTSKLPLVHSLSVGEPEDEFDQSAPGGVSRANNEMMALGARGISIIFASGDRCGQEIVASVCANLGVVVQWIPAYSEVRL